MKTIFLCSCGDYHEWVVPEGVAVGTGDLK